MRFIFDQEYATKTEQDTSVLVSVCEAIPFGYHIMHGKD